MIEFDTAGQPISSTPCRWCGCYHTGVCPWVSAIEYHPDGSIRRVEFHGYAQQPILQPSDEAPRAKLGSIA